MKARNERIKSAPKDMPVRHFDKLNAAPKRAGKEIKDG
jgi:hypothetical protein